MSNIVIFKNGVAQYLPSVNTPEYSNDPDVVINPDLSALEGVAMKYWKRAGNNVVEMSAVEKEVIDTTFLNERKAQAETYNVDIKTVLTALIKVINLRLPSNKITKQEMIDAIKAEVL